VNEKRNEVWGNGFLTAGEVLNNEGVKLIGFLGCFRGSLKNDLKAVEF
jgi:hypothetical protein